MLKLERISYDPQNWAAILERYPAHSLGQRPEWLAFLAESQGAEVVTAAVLDGASVVGHFVGLLVRRFGLRMLGSPLPGWTTSYMGFCLSPETPHVEAVTALRRFAFRELGCVHLELMDREISLADIESVGAAFRLYSTFEIDLTMSEDSLFARMAPACRRCVRKAERTGVRIEQAMDVEFVNQYYEQLGDVFAKQRLTPTYSIDRVRSLMRHLGPSGHLLCLRAVDAEGRCIATGIFPAANGRAYFWGGASWRQHQHLRSNELLMWHAWSYWKSRGARTFNMGGAGEYKRKYGGRELTVGWLRQSRYPILPMLRDAAATAVRLRQRWNALLQPLSAAGRTTSTGGSAS